MALIKKVEIRGFKSLGKRTTTLQLDEGLTAITGPNGSGKSNIFDAITFCLGESSPKILRVNKLTSLLYDGGPSGQKSSSTKVTLTFENSERNIPVDTNTVTISRDLRLNGDNVYYLNGKRIQKGTLTDMLSIALLDSRGLQIVPQGMITNTSELSPDEKRVVIEELVGVAQFDQRKSEAMKQLHDADVKLQVATARIGEIKNRVQSLEGERNDQLRLKQLEDEIRWLRAVLASKNLSNSRDRLKDQQDVFSNLSRQISELKQQLQTLSDETSSLDVERKSFLSTVVEGASGRQYELQFSIAKATSELGRIKKDIADSEHLIRRLEGSLPKMETKKSDETKTVFSVQGQVNTQNQIVKDLEKRKTIAENELSRIDRRSTKLERQIADGKRRVDRLSEKVSQYSELAANALKQLDHLKSRQSVASERMKTLEDKSNSFMETLKELEGNLEKLENLKKLEIKSLEGMNRTLDSLSDRKVRLDEEVTNSLSIIDRANEAILRYDTQKNIAEQIATDEVGLRTLEELSEAGAMDEIHGRFDKLISYDSRFKKAVMTVGRRWMKSIIVKDFDSILRLIDTTKRLKITGVGMIPLSEVARSGHTSYPAIEGVIGVLSELVRSKKDVLGVVNFVFGDTILVESTQVAYTISSSGLRAVTLDGDIFEPKGKAFESGYIGRLDEIVRLIESAKSFSAVKQALNSLRPIIKKRKSDLTQLEKQSKQLDREKIQRSIMIERLEEELQGAIRFIAKYQRLRKVLDLQREKIWKTDEKTTRQIQRLSSTYSNLQSKIGQITSTIEDETTESLVQERRKTSEERNNLIRQIENVSSQIRNEITKFTQYQGNLEHSLKPNLARLEAETKQSMKDLAEKNRFVEESSRTLEELNANLNRWKSDEKGLLKSSKKSRPILEGYDAKLKRLRGSENSLRSSLTSLEKEQVRVTKTIERISEIEGGYLSELTLYGYSKPVKFFDEADVFLNHLNIDYDRMKRSVNLLADKSYREVFTGYKNLSIRSNQLDIERMAIVRFIEGIDLDKRKVFIGAFEKIDQELREIFKKLTKGSAWLELENPDDIFSSGVFLMTQFPDKNPRESSSVSGGEKTVSALSFILAIQSVYPSPFYLFDEIDAHLDPVNTENLADLLRERAKQSQIIVVTLKDSALARASAIFGVYIGNGISHMVRYKPGMEVTVNHA